MADSFLLKCFGLDNLISAASAAFFNYPSSTTFRYTSVPTGASVKGRGFGPINRELKPNADNGKAVYAAKCASCHGANGEGMKDAKGAYTFPALWGKDSFNVGAGMARTYTAAAFVKHNMPLGQPNTLTDQEAIDIAEFFTHQPRPDYAPKAKDWPKGDKPKDARS